MNVDIITPSNKLYSGEINSIKVPGSDGEFEILKNHAPIISSLNKGIIRVIDKDNNTENFEINGGVIEMQKNNIIAGIQNGQPEYAEKMLKKGVQLVTIGSDQRYMTAASKAALSKLKKDQNKDSGKGY